MAEIPYYKSTHIVRGDGPRTRIEVCTISNRLYHNGFADSRQSAVIHAMARGFDVVSLSVNECRIDEARNYAVKDALAEKPVPEYLIFFDDDMAIPHDIIPRLVTNAKETNADVVGCLYTGRGFPCVTIVEAPNRLPVSIQMAKRLHDDNSVVDVSAVGFGSTLVRTAIFYKLKSPWFYFGESGEDWNFCHDVKSIGGKVVCDFGVKSHYREKTYPGVAHLGVYPYSLLDAEVAQ